MDTNVEEWNLARASLRWKGARKRKIVASPVARPELLYSRG
jgi:hypothetical protein